MSQLEIPFNVVSEEFQVMNQEKPVEKFIEPPKLDKEIFKIQNSTFQDIFKETIKLPFFPLFVDLKRTIIIIKTIQNLGDQMHGVGKTTLIKNLLKHAPKYKKEIIENLKSSMEEHYEKDFFEKTLERIFNMKQSSKLFNYFVQEKDEIARKIVSVIFENEVSEELALNGKSSSEMKQHDYFLHIDEVTTDFELIRKLCGSLVTLKLELSKHDIIFDFYLTGKRTLYNKVFLIFRLIVVLICHLHPLNGF
eukprot:gene6455-10461_t